MKKKRYILMAISFAISVLIFIKKSSENSLTKNCLNTNDNNQIMKCVEQNESLKLLTIQEQYDLVYKQYDKAYSDSYDKFYYSFKKSYELCLDSTCNIHNKEFLNLVENICIKNSKNSSDFCVKDFFTNAGVNENNTKKLNDIILNMENTDKPHINYCTEGLYNYYKKLNNIDKKMLQPSVQNECDKANKSVDTN